MRAHTHTHIQSFQINYCCNFHTILTWALLLNYCQSTCEKKIYFYLHQGFWSNGLQKYGFATNLVKGGSWTTQGRNHWILILIWSKERMQETSYRYCEICHIHQFSQLDLDVKECDIFTVLRSVTYSLMQIQISSWIWQACVGLFGLGGAMCFTLEILVQSMAYSQKSPSPRSPRFFQHKMEAKLKETACIKLGIHEMLKQRKLSQV